MAASRPKCRGHLVRRYRGEAGASSQNARRQRGDSKFCLAVRPMRIKRRSNVEALLRAAASLRPRPERISTGPAGVLVLGCVCATAGTPSCPSAAAVVRWQLKSGRPIAHCTRAPSSPRPPGPSSTSGLLRPSRRVLMDNFRLQGTHHNKDQRRAPSGALRAARAAGPSRRVGCRRPGLFRENHLSVWCRWAAAALLLSRRKFDPL